MNNARKLILVAALTLPIMINAGCGGSGSDQQSGDTPAAADPSGLTQEQLEKGLGPISSVTLTAIDDALVAQGEAIFTSKCAACHKMNERYVGPALAGVTDRRAPEYVMNMMLNPDQMIKEHPEAKKMFASFMTPMPSQNLTEEDARALLEYLRTQQPEEPTEN